MNVFSHLKSQLSILDVIGEYTTLKKAGLYYKGVCPFHSEKTASFTVSPHKEIFYCFGCQAGGDVIAFIAKAENCSQIESVHHLIDRYNIELPETTSLNLQSTAEHNQEKKQYYDLCKLVADWCVQNLQGSPSTQQYLLKRGYTKESLSYFSIGYFPGGLASIRRLINFVNKHNFLTQDLLNAHIIVKGRQVLYSPFEERIMFPIKDHLGRHCGFGGRIFKEHDERAKYYNSRENEFFTKGSLLFGLDLAKHDIQKQESVFVVEGYTDCLAMFQHGYTNTVATLGTACTLDHLSLLARQAHTMYILYDGDKAGQKAILRLTELCWETNLELKVIMLPAEDDPASYLAQGKDLKTKIESAQDIFLFFVQTLGSSFKNMRLNDKLKTIKKLTDLLSNIANPLKRDILLQRAAQVFGIPFESLSDELNRSIDKGTANPSPRTNLSEELSPDHDELKYVGQLEKKLFSVIMDNAQLVCQGNGRYIIRYFSPFLKTILEKRIATYEQEGAVDFSVFFDMLNDKEQSVVTKIVAEHDEEDKDTAFKKLLLQFQKKHWKTIVSDIKEQLYKAEQEKNTEKMRDLLSAFQALKKTLLSRGLL